MKQPKRLTREMKILLAKKRLKPENWMLVSETKTEFTAIKKNTNTIRTFAKE